MSGERARVARGNLFKALFLTALGINPFLIVFRAVNDDETTGHRGVAGTAELRAVDLKTTDLRRL